ncbi:MAG TPA: hypothetical protein VK890_11085 [Bacteroidia bacterium]|jgi:hypothetical protein|nr:hypothetical protein [Bacteroidia bacterium]
MKTILSLCFVFALTICTAQEKKDTAKVKEEDRPGPVATGKVMHLDNQHCPTVIAVVRPVQKDTLFFLPIGPGMEGFDKPGITVTFKYRKLNIKQPLGCTGLTVNVYDVKRVMPIRRRKKAPQAK